MPSVLVLRIVPCPSGFQPLCDVLNQLHCNRSSGSSAPFLSKAVPTVLAHAVVYVGQVGCTVRFGMNWLVVRVIQICHSPIRMWLVNLLHLRRVSRGGAGKS